MVKVRKTPAKNSKPKKTNMETIERRLSNQNTGMIQNSLRRTRSFRVSLKHIGNKWLTTKLPGENKKLMDKSLSTSDIRIDEENLIKNKTKPFLSPQKDYYYSNKKTSSDFVIANNRHTVPDSTHKSKHNFKLDFLTLKSQKNVISEPPLVVPRKAAAILQIPVVTESVTENKENFDLKMTKIEQNNNNNNRLSQYISSTDNLTCNIKDKPFSRYDGFIRSSMRISSKARPKSIMWNSSFSSTSRMYKF